ncbi:MAG: hypothetical protein Q8Q56_03955, partial [Alphaproteobacteria bacterium]|nr:hypothetical protein [Alphaproteobacteria bacterium]
MKKFLLLSACISALSINFGADAFSWSENKARLQREYNTAELVARASGDDFSEEIEKVQTRLKWIKEAKDPDEALKYLGWALSEVTEDGKVKTKTIYIPEKYETQRIVEAKKQPISDTSWKDFERKISNFQRELIARSDVRNVEVRKSGELPGIVCLHPLAWWYEYNAYITYDVISDKTNLVQAARQETKTLSTLKYCLEQIRVILLVDQQRRREAERQAEAAAERRRRAEQERLAAEAQRAAEARRREEEAKRKAEEERKRLAEVAREAAERERQKRQAEVARRVAERTGKTAQQLRELGLCYLLGKTSTGTPHPLDDRYAGQLLLEAYDKGDAESALLLAQSEFYGGPSRISYHSLAEVLEKGDARKAQSARFSRERFEAYCQEAYRRGIKNCSDPKFAKFNVFYTEATKALRAEDARKAEEARRRAAEAQKVEAARRVAERTGKTAQQLRELGLCYLLGKTSKSTQPHWMGYNLSGETSTSTPHPLDDRYAGQLLLEAYE